MPKFVIKPVITRNRIFAPMKYFATLPFLLIAFVSCSQNYPGIKAGAERIDFYLPKIQNKTVAVVANHTSLVGKSHLVDTLLALGVNVKVIFSPEHGFRGNSEAGALISSYIDEKTHIQVYSLYSKWKKPVAKQLEGIDVVLFDLQDVGVRFYTYISTLHYVMEACAEYGKQCIVLDRPNPNGFYVDGPVLDTAFRSFVGMHPVPIVYGLTIAEFAQMINGEGWLKNGEKCNLAVVPCEGYNHNIAFPLPVKPSPNLPNQQSVLLYPSLGLFEGTAVSVGRGTDFPFQVFGFPDFPVKNFSFTPVEKPGASVNPPYKEKKCYGIDLRGFAPDYFIDRKALILDWLIYAYRSYPQKEKFFNNFFRLLAGNDELKKQIISGMSADDIRKSWQPDLKKYKAIRKKYLLYKDFE